MYVCKNKYGRLLQNFQEQVRMMSRDKITRHDGQLSNEKDASRKAVERKRHKLKRSRKIQMCFFM
jgi:hypothetical protein